MPDSVLPNDICTAFSYKISKDRTVKLNALLSHEGKIVIPGTIEGCPVVAFNKGIFKNNQTITAVVWPAEIPVLPSEIFFGCSALREITLPEGVNEISEKAFRNCISLTEITIPASVTKIHEQAFECAQNTMLGWKYWNCVKTVYGTADSYAAQFAKAANITFLSDSTSDKEAEQMCLYRYHKVADGIALDDFTVTDDMPRTKPVAGQSQLERFEIPNEILGEPVVELSVDFHKCQKQFSMGDIRYDPIAATLVIPPNLKRIRCPLDRRVQKEVVVSPDNTSIIFDHYAWYEDGGETIVSEWNSFSLFRSPREYAIREGTVRACGEMSQAFALDKLEVPDSFVEPCDGFLLPRRGLRSRSTVQKIYATYDSCMREYAAKIGAQFVATDRQEIVYSEDGTILLNCPQLFAQDMFYIPESVRIIEKDAFKGNEGIREIVIPDTVEKIGAGAFAECTMLEKVVLPKHITELPDRLFADCAKLNTVVLPTAPERIGKKCFYNTALQGVDLPDTVREIDDYAFSIKVYGKSQMASIVLPKSVRKLGISVCAGIADITVYDSIDPASKPAQDHCDEINGCWNSRLGCIGILQKECYVWGACNSHLYRHTITVRSSEDDHIQYKVLIYGEEEQKNVCYAMVSSWGRNAGFRFATVDEKFSKLKDAENRLATVLNRLAYPVDLSDETKEKYLSWLKRNSTKVTGELIAKGDLSGLQDLAQYGILTKKNIPNLIELATAASQVEIAAYLLNYQNTL